MWRPYLQITFIVLECSFLLLLVEPSPYFFAKRAVIKTSPKSSSQGPIWPHWFIDDKRSGPIWPHWFVDDKRSGAFGGEQSLSGQCALAIKSKIQCWSRSGPAVERALDLLLDRNAMESAVDAYRVATFVEPCIHQPAPWSCCAEDRSGTQSDCGALEQEYERFNDIYQTHKTAVGEKRWAKFAYEVKLDVK